MKSKYIHTGLSFISLIVIVFSSWACKWILQPFQPPESDIPILTQDLLPTQTPTKNFTDPNNPPELALSWVESFKSPSESLKVMIEYQKKLYLGGSTGQSAGKIYVYDGKTWTDLNFVSSDGFSIDLIESMYVFEDNLFIGTRVHDSNNDFYSRVYSYNGKNFSIDFSTNGANGCSGIEAIAVHDGGLYAANGACGFGEVFMRKAAGRWETTGGLIEKDGVAIGSPVRALTSYNGGLYAGTGAFGAHAKLWQRMNGEWELVEDFYQTTTYGKPDGIWSLSTYINRLYVGFASKSTTIPSYDGSGWASSLATPKCGVVRLASIGGRLWAGFCDGTIYVNEKGKWAQSGKLPNNLIYAIVQYGDYVYISTDHYSVYSAFMPPIK